MVAIHGLGVKDPQRPRIVDTSKMPPRYPFKVHRTIRHVAKELAGTFWEGIAHYSAPKVNATGDMAPLPFLEERSKAFRNQWPSQKLYVAWLWPMFVKTARATLATSLSDGLTPEHLKPKIYKALLEDFDERAFQEHIAPALRGFGPT